MSGTAGPYQVSNALAEWRAVDARTIASHPPPPTAHQKTEAGKVFPLTRCALGRRRDETHRLIPVPAGFDRLGSVLLGMYGHHYPERVAAQRLERRQIRDKGHGSIAAPWAAGCLHNSYRPC